MQVHRLLIVSCNDRNLGLKVHRADFSHVQWFNEKHGASLSSANNT